MKSRSWGSLYELALAVALAAMLLYAVGNSAVPDILAEAERRGHPPGWVSASLLFFVLGLWSGGWYFAGPLAVSAGRLQWLAWRRHPSRWLRREAVKVLVVGALLAAVIAVLAGLASAAIGSSSVVPSLVTWTVLVLLVMVTIYVQRRDLDGIARLVPITLGAVGVVIATGVAWNALVAAIIGCGLMVSVAAARPRTLLSTGVRSELTPRWQLQRGARNRWSVGAGVTLMDGEIVRIVRQRDAKVIRRLLPESVYRASWPVNLAIAVLIRSFPAVAIGIALALPLIFAVHEILGLVPAMLVGVFLEFFVTLSTSRSAETWLASRALPRTWAVSGIGTSIALVVPSLAVCLAIAMVMMLGFSLSPLVTLVLVVLPVGIIMRRHAAPDAGTSVTVASTPMGAVSLQAVNKAIAGPDVVLLSLVLVSWLT
ncbi:hypothetical protein [Phytoactinopolyspora halophila]|nr:hypothetical protein [Phytoactinopolyspora halophila]